MIHTGIFIDTNMRARTLESSERKYHWQQDLKALDTLEDILICNPSLTNILDPVLALSAEKGERQKERPKTGRKRGTET